MPERTAYAAGKTVKWLVLAGPAVLAVLIGTPDPPLATGGLVFGAS